jgi:hypothetical protein
MIPATSIEHPKLPQELSPLNLKAYFGFAFGRCGCSDVEAIHALIRDFLKWHDEPVGDREKFDTLFIYEGIFYVLAGMLDNLRLAEHGVSIRNPWLTGEGKRLLAALEVIDPTEIDVAEGEAYDGLYYPGEKL